MSVITSPVVTIKDESGLGFSRLNAPAVPRGDSGFRIFVVDLRIVPNPANGIGVADFIALGLWGVVDRTRSA